MKKIIVISLGGSIIIPNTVNIKFLDKLKSALRKHYSTTKFVIVCGGGKIARDYIKALEKEGRSKFELSQAGIRATRMNALFLMQFFGKDANSHLPMDMKEVENKLEKHDVVICGALRYAKNSTSDGTAAKLAIFLKTGFINITNVPGLFNSDPRQNKDAKLIPNISWKDFKNKALKIKFHAGQHFVLDQNAAILIKKYKIKTYIIGSIISLENILKHKKFIGTTIEG